MARAELRWSIPPSVLAARVAGLAVTLPHRIDTLAAEVAVQGEAYAKLNRVWTDRTGAARAGLHGESDVHLASGSIVLEHGVDYGIWLEIANQGRYAILPQTIDYMVGLVAEGLDGMLLEAIS